MSNTNDLIAMIQAKPELAHKTIAKLKRIRRRDQKKTGYTESHVHVALDPIGKPLKLTEQELIEQRIADYDAIIESNPFVIAKAEVAHSELKAKLLVKAELREARLKRDSVRDSGLREVAIRTIKALMQEPDDNGVIRPLNNFEREVRKELRLAEQMGITIPFLFKGSKATLKSTIQAEYKAITSYLNHEDDLEQISTAIAEMSIDERLQYEKIARKFVSKLITEDNNNERT